MAGDSSICVEKMKSPLTPEFIANSLKRKLPSNYRIMILAWEQKFPRIVLSNCSCDVFRNLEDNRENSIPSARVFYFQSFFFVMVGISMTACMRWSM